MEQINLYDLIKFYGRKWRVILVFTLAGLVTGLAYNTLVQVPLFQSSSKLIVVTSPTSATSSNQTLINNYIDLITSRRVLEPVLEKQDKSISYEKLVSQVKAVNQKDTAVIDVTVTTTSAKQSTDTANEITKSFTGAINNLYQTNGVIVIDPAVSSTSPTNVHTELQLITTTIVGLIASFIALFFVYDYTGGKITKPTSKKKVAKKTIRTNKRKILAAKIKSLLTKIAALFASKPAKKVITKATVRKGTAKAKPATPKRTSTKVSAAKTSKSITAKKTPSKKVTPKRTTK